MMIKSLPQLMNLAYNGYNRALPQPNGAPGDFQPIFSNDGTLEVTFCNVFVDYVCNGLNYSDFKGMLANEMFDYMNTPKNKWISFEESVAQWHANQGALVLAAHKNSNGHGHICVVLPGLLEKSSSFNKAVPKCVNVGKDVFFGKKISFAFPKEEQPIYFSLADLI